MRIPAVTILLTLAVTTSAVVGAAPIDDVAGARGRRGAELCDGKRRAGGHREIWRSLTDEQRRELRGLFDLLKEKPFESRRRLLERLGKLPPEERLAEIARAREAILKEDAEWRRVERRIRAVERESRKKFTLPEELQKRLEGITDRKERHEAIRNYFFRRFRAQRQATLDALPESVRKRVAAMSRREQTEYLRRYKSLELVGSVFPSERTRRAAMRWSPDQVLALLERESGSAKESEPAKEPARPEFFPKASWEKWVELEGYERLRVLRTILELRREGGQGHDASGERDRRSRGGKRGRLRDDDRDRNDDRERDNDRDRDGRPKDRRRGSRTPDGDRDQK